MFCNKCGNSILEGQKFCTKCGNKIEINSEPKVISQSVEPQVNPVTQVASNPVEQPVIKEPIKKKSNIWNILYFLFVGFLTIIILILIVLVILTKFIGI